MPPPERIAAFDNDGTLWCEKPMPIQADFLLRRLSEMAQADSGLRDGQPWKAAYERDYGWFGTVITSTTRATTPTWVWPIPSLAVGYQSTSCRGRFDPPDG